LGTRTLVRAESGEEVAIAGTEVAGSEKQRTNKEKVANEE